MWLKDANLMASKDPSFDTDDFLGDGFVLWQRAFDYIQKLNQEGYLGYSDWRLPNITELASLIDAERISPESDIVLPMDHPFINVLIYGNGYWTSTSVVAFPNLAFTIIMTPAATGSIEGRYKSGQYAIPAGVWPVRSGDSGLIKLPRTGQQKCWDEQGILIACSGTGQDGDIQAGAAWPDPRFEDNGDAMVTDRLTGIIWTKNANLMLSRDPEFDTDGISVNGAVPWQQALEYIQKLNQEEYLGYSDWRLPNWIELKSLLDYNRYQPALSLGNPFTNIPTPDIFWPSSALIYWSSTTGQYRADYTRVIDFSFGQAWSSYKIDNSFFIWPVRGGHGPPPPAVFWAKSYGGPKDDIASGIQPTPDGGYIVAGTTSSFGAGGKDFWVLKLDGDGNPVWQKTFGGRRDDIAAAIQVTPDGGYIVAGTTSSFGAGRKDFWVLKLDTEGNPEWQRTYGQKFSDDVAYSISHTSDGGYILAGTSAELWISERGRVVKIDSLGLPEWEKSYDHYPFYIDRIISIAPNNKGYIMAGSTQPIKVPGAIQIASWAFWVTQLNASGEPLWSKTYGDVGFDKVAFSMHPTPDGGSIVVGLTGLEPAKVGSAWAIKLKEDGEYAWQKTYHNGITTAFFSISPTPDGGYVAAGITNSRKNKGDFWILKIDNDSTLGPSCTLDSNTSQGFSEIRLFASGTSLLSRPTSVEGNETYVVPVNTSIQGQTQCE